MNGSDFARQSHGWFPGVIAREGGRSVFRAVGRSNQLREVLDAPLSPGLTRAILYAIA
jgi:hypothetical protein